MKQKFRGTYVELQDKVLFTGIYGEWTDLGNQKQFRAEDGGVLNWWESTKTITFQGPPSAANKLETALSYAFGASPAAAVADEGHGQPLKEENTLLRKRLAELMQENAKLERAASGK